MTRQRRSREAGFTLMGLIVAITILGVAFMGMGSVIPRLFQATTQTEVDFLTLTAIEDRMQLILMDPRYEQLAALYDGREDAVTHLPGVERETEIVRTIQDMGNGRSLDFTTITVTTQLPPFPPMSRTVTRGAP